MSINFQNVTNFEDVSFSVSSQKRKIGYVENFIFELDSPVTRIRSFFIENVQFPNTKYIFNSGNNTFGWTSSGIEFSAIIDILPGFYTGSELASEFTNRMSEGQPFTNLIGDYTCTYNVQSNKFRFAGGASPITIYTKQNLFADNDLTSSQTFFSNPSITPTISLTSADGESFIIAQLNETNPVNVNDNPGEYFIETLYAAHENFNIVARNTGLSVHEFTPISGTVADVTTTASVTGFVAATEIQTAFTTASLVVQVRYNYNNNRFRIFRISGPDKFKLFRIDLGIGFLGESDASLVLGPTLNQEIAFDMLPNLMPKTIITTNNTFVISEGSGSDISIVLDDIVVSDVSLLAPILEAALNASTLLNFTYEVTWVKHRAKFRIKSVLRKAIFDIFSIKSTGDVSSDFGFTSNSLNKAIHVSNSAQFGLLKSVDFISSYYALATANVPIGIYTISEILVVIESAIVAESDFGNIYTFTYDVNKLLFTLTRTGGVNSLTPTMWTSSGGAFKLFGYVSDNIDSLLGVMTSQSVATLYGSQYLYIKSNALTDKKITKAASNPAYKNIIGKIILDNPAGIEVFNQGTVNAVSSLANNITLQSVDIRIEDEDGTLYAINGSEWAFSIVFERF